MRENENKSKQKQKKQNKIKLIEEDRIKENKINWTRIECVRATHKINRNKRQNS